MSLPKACSCGDRASPEVRCARCGLHIARAERIAVDAQAALGERLEFIHTAAVDVLDLVLAAAPDTREDMVAAIAGLLDERFGPALAGVGHEPGGD